MKTLRVVDIETTGLEPPAAEVLELGFVDLKGEGKSAGWELFPSHTAALFRPINGISPETMAVHHITLAEVAEKPIGDPAALRGALMADSTPDVLVAHNCAFERRFLTDDVTGGLPWICTYKCALRLWPDAPGHSNQILRYWRQHEHGEEDAMPPHRALPDAFVTGHILWDMLELATVEQLIQWSSEPKFMPRVPFGKHRGALWADVPEDYLAWITRQADMDGDVIWNAERELRGR